MAFTFTNYAGLPIPRSPMNAMIQNAMDMYNKSTQADLSRMQLQQEKAKAPYLMPQLQNALMKQQMELQQYPEQLQANLFAKKFGPLASLVNTPMYLQNPKFQEAINNLIIKNLGSEMGMTNNTKNNFPTFNENVQKEIKSTEQLANELTKAGSAKTGTSGWIGAFENTFGDLGKSLLNTLGINKIATPELSQQKKEFDTHLARLKKIALDTQLVKPEDAIEQFSQHKNETPEQVIERLKHNFPSIFNQENQSNKSNENDEEQYYRDQTDKIAAKLEASGFDVPIPIIYNYLKELKGNKVSLPDILKKAGIKYGK